MKHVIRLFLCAALLLAFLSPSVARAEAAPIRCVPGETIEVTFVLPDSAGDSAGVMGRLTYDYNVFTLLPSPGVIGQNGIYISSQPVSLAFAVSQYAPVGEYVIEVTVLEAYDADGHLCEITEIEPVPVSVVPAGYSVRYEPGAENSGIRDIPEPQEKAFREPLVLSTVRPARAGYDFMGWAVSAGGNAVYQPGDTYQDDQEVTLYAVWQPIPTGKLAVNGWLDDNKNANSVEGYGTFDVYINDKLVKDNVSDYSEDVPADCTYLIKDIRPASGHVYSETAEGELHGTVASGQTVSIRLKFLSIYKIEFKQNTADSVHDMPSTQTKQYGQSLTLSEKTPTRSGYTFQGWALSATGNVQYKAGSACAENKNLTLYAVWQPIPNGKLDVNGWLDDNKNAGGTDNYGTFDMYINGKLVKDNVSDFYEDVPAGCTYEIKDIRPTGGHVYSGAVEGELRGTVGSGKTVNIRLKFLSTYKIEFKQNTTDSVSDMPSTQNKEHGQSLTISSKVPTRSGYTFQGWALSPTGGVQYKAGSSCSENKNLALYAFWKPMGILDVNGWLDDNKTAGGTDGYGTFDMYIDGKLVMDNVTDYYKYVSPGSTYEIKDIRPTAGHYYAGVPEGQLKGTVESGKTISVRLKFLSQYTIQFNKNTTESVTGMPSDQKKNHGEGLKLSNQSPVRLGYTFLGWSLTASGTAKYRPGATCTENKNTTLYAVWQAPSKMFESLNVATYYFEGNMRYLIQIYLKGVKQRTTFKNIKVSWTDKMVYSATENNLKSNNTISFQETEKNGDKKLNIVLPKEWIGKADQTIRFQYGDEVITVSVRLSFNSGTWHVDYLGYKVSKP